MEKLVCCARKSFEKCPHSNSWYLEIIHVDKTFFWNYFTELYNYYLLLFVKWNTLETHFYIIKFWLTWDLRQKYLCTFSFFLNLHFVYLVHTKIWKWWPFLLIHFAYSISKGFDSWKNQFLYFIILLGMDISF